jgi:hypothetical protein
LNNLFYPINKKNMPYLNGKFTKAEDIDPSKHTFVGTFRPPSFKPVGAFICSCGQLLQYARETQDHWRAGCMDEPQYVDIEHNVSKS